MLFDDTLRDVLKKIRTIAVIGAKDKPGQPVDMVGRYLIDAGYNVIPVHPVRKSVWGLPTYASILDIPVAVDLVDLFRASEACLAHAEEVSRLATMPSVFWMQSGISNPDAGRLMAAKGVKVVEDKCLMVELERLGIAGPA
jgi:hypothetical protein